MKKITNIIAVIIFCSGICSYSFASEPDTAFRQPVSVKYHFSEELKGSVLKKVVVDYNDNVFVLSDKGLYRVYENEVVKDLRYRSLSDKVPVDITTQENTGDLYYLYDSCFLTNAYAGKPYGALPKGEYNKISVAADGRVFLAGDAGVAVFSHGILTNIPTSTDKIISIHVYQGTFYALSANGVFYLSDNKLTPISKGEGLQTFTFYKNRIILGTGNGYYEIYRSTGAILLPLQTRLPVQNINNLINVEGKIWAGTPDGAMQYGTGQFHYYASKRWLNENFVSCMAADTKGDVYLLTPSGLNEIKFIQNTLLNKANVFQKNIRKRHIRYGLESEVTMKVPGDLSTAQMLDTDNDGLWTSFYLGSQAFRYAVTKDPQAKRYAWESFAAYERLISINQIKGFPARTFERKGYKNSDPDRWNLSPDSNWEWKGTTSSDEFVGYIFVASVMDQFIAKTKEEKKRVADFIDKILTHIIDHNYNFVDIDGKPTRWGRWNPEYVNSYAKSISDRKLGSEDIVAGLELGYALTGKELYKREAFRLMYKNGYLDNIMIDVNDIKATPGDPSVADDKGNYTANHSDDEMTFLTYWVLYHYAFNKDLKQKFSKTIHNYWQVIVPEKNPLWNLITYGTAGSLDKASTLWYLREFPMDMIRWTIKNSQRKDLTFLKPNFREQFTRQLLSPEEQPLHRHNANPFDLDDNSGGRNELSGSEYLLPYWMARYLKVIDKNN
ncbi:MAG: hypothetical protein Q8891_07085 [Bacteroidota bacterium]|nr:hypothetical protein [Bacteroidota bacterium]